MNTTRTCRACPATLTTSCAWCPTCQAARLEAARAKLAAHPTPKRVRVDKNGKPLRSQVNWCR